MGEFSAEWLALREPADHRSRDVDLVSLVIEHAAGSAAAPLRVLDLGTGSGSNARYLLPRLPRQQDWCLVDRDVDLLRELTKRLSAWGLDRGGAISGGATSFAIRGRECDWRFQLCAADLAKLLDAATAPSLFAPLFAGRALVTGSALLDLVSERWLQALVAQCAAVHATVLFVLTYDGRLACTPADEDDEFVRGLVNRHQQTAKGFGRALGPDANAAAVRLFEAAGYAVQCRQSDWVLTPVDAALQRPLIDGWADAAAEIARKGQDRVRAWQQRRLAHLDAGVSHLVVGHQDLAGWPVAH